MKLAFQCRPALEAYALALLKNYSDAEDVVQDAYLVIMDRWEDFEEGTSMISWSRAIVRRKVLQLLDRKRRNTKVQEQLLRDAVDAAFDHAYESRRAQHRQFQEQIIAICLTRPTDRAREILRLIYNEGKNYSQVAEAVSIGIEGVRKSLFRARGQLRECAAQEVKNAP